MSHNAAVRIAFVLTVMVPALARAQVEQEQRCPASPPANAQHLAGADAHSLSSLVGEYRLETLRTTPGLPRERMRAQLTVQVTDSIKLYYQPIIGPVGRRHRQPLTAHLRWDWDTTTTGRPGIWRLRRESLVSDPGSDCQHCGGATFRIGWVTGDEFGGTWMQGFDGLSLVGPDGRTFDGIDGSFCAWRMPETRPQA